MMYGFGDDQVPFTESVDLLEDLVVEYITEMVRSFSVVLCCGIHIPSIYSFLFGTLPHIS